MARRLVVAFEAVAEDATTRARLVEAALLLFRRRGYHGVGISEVLAESGISKGSLYHHFPDGKQALGVAVVQELAARMIEMFERNHRPTTEQLLRRVGQTLGRWMQRTGDDTLAMLASFVVESHDLPELRLAVRTAYQQIEQWLKRRLESDGFDATTALERAQLSVALFEGGGVLSQAHGQPRMFLRAVECAARLCTREPL
jgi:TetR/AcrR family transcriptional repressor of lmrAB and yxaGH operons